MTTDDEILTLLREIRDIQQQHLEVYRAQSQWSISMTTAALKRQRIGLIVVVVAACIGVWYGNSGESEWKAIQDRAQQQMEQSDKQWKQQMEDWQRARDSQR